MTKDNSKDCALAGCSFSPTIGSKFCAIHTKQLIDLGLLDEIPHDNFAKARGVKQ